MRGYWDYDNELGRWWGISFGRLFIGVVRTTPKMVEAVSLFKHGVVSSELKVVAQKELEVCPQCNKPLNHWFRIHNSLTRRNEKWCYWCKWKPVGCGMSS